MSDDAATPDERWRVKAVGTLFYSDGSHTSLSIDRPEELHSAVEILNDMVSLLDSQTAWEIERCVIDMRCYRERP